MIKLILGGARSGKSEFAEDIYKGIDDVTYIATAKAIDKEFANRIALHKARRNAKWTTIEAYKDFVCLDMKTKYYFLDDVTNMLTNILFDHIGDRDITDEDASLVEKLVIDEFMALFKNIKEMGADLIIVSSELGAGLVPEAKLSRLFRDMHGKVNQYIAKNADEVYYVIASIGVKIK
ncbi:bifunctional adenosylcobinamide kinase/adenosylcobinamide-phosphate guanylyltransferase [Fenollaria timonensis]|uniref:bifunctional adenosylcobinamide kinase/adenosylcobinamide-phosphate guanylyltransferase n=1 Tax=Fenollaria timonensis TaxID=1723384 RepID=UPI0026F28181|nr:bifunctional adenosylcobinamide kinase/adenosylcobinamide-phosphate guanylyltransferase [Fenollaria timonensis]